MAVDGFPERAEVLRDWPEKPVMKTIPLTPALTLAISTAKRAEKEVELQEGRSWAVDDYKEAWARVGELVIRENERA